MNNHETNTDRKKTSKKNNKQLKTTYKMYIQCIYKWPIISIIIIVTTMTTTHYTWVFSRVMISGWWRRSGLRVSPKSYLNPSNSRHLSMLEICASLPQARVSRGAKTEMEWAAQVKNHNFGWQVQITICKTLHKCAAPWMTCLHMVFVEKRLIFPHHLWLGGIKPNPETKLHLSHCIRQSNSTFYGSFKNLQL